MVSPPPEPVYPVATDLPTGQRTLTIVGVGPGDPNLRTIAAQKALDSAVQIVLRTAIHPGVADIAADARTTTCDDLYEKGTSFDEVYGEIVDRVLGLVREQDVVFAVPGHPYFGERTVRALLDAVGDDININVLPGISALDAIVSATGHDPMAEQAQLLDAVELAISADREPFSRGLTTIDPARPVVLSQVFSHRIAAVVKLFLSDIFDDEHPVTIVTAGSVPGQQRVVTVPLHALDHQPVDHLTSVWVPAANAITASRSGATLMRIVARLRTQDGCPWDREQRHETLRAAILDEAYEVVDAIDNADPDNLAEELGDLLLLVHMHAQIAEEAGTFSIADVFDTVNRKLVRRHPHVFGDVKAETADQVLTTWNDVKAAERAAKGEAKVKSVSALDRWPASMPPMTKAVRVIAREQRKRRDAGQPATDRQDASDTGERLLDLISTAVANGIDPERELRDALIERFGKSPI